MKINVDFDGCLIDDLQIETRNAAMATEPKTTLTLNKAQLILLYKILDDAVDNRSMMDPENEEDSILLGLVEMVDSAGQIFNWDEEA